MSMNTPNHLGDHKSMPCDMNNQTPLGEDIYAIYETNHDEVDEICITDGTGLVLAVLTPDEAMRLGEFAQERQARYS